MAVFVNPDVWEGVFLLFCLCFLLDSLFMDIAREWGVCYPCGAMKQYVVDELRPPDHEKVKAYLDERYFPGGLERLYWIPLEQEMLTDLQRRHEACQPLYFALELRDHQLACELLVRTRERVRCDCIGYATEIQRNWLIRCIDAIFEELGIKI